MAGQQSASGLIIAGKGLALPLKDISVVAEVKGYVLGLQSTLKYCNDSPDPVEVLFRFPVEQSHAVVGLTAVIDGRRIRAQVREKEEARAAYDDAIASGRSAAFAEEKSGDVFSISLGNLPPQKEAEIQLQLVGELPIDAEGGVRFSLPTTLKPRYTPTGSSDPLTPVPSGDSDQVEQASIAGAHSFQMTVLDAEDVAEVTSPTHDINVIKEEEGFRVALSERKPSGKDLVILIKHKAPHTLKAVVERGASTGKEENAFMSSPAVMVNFFPEFPNEEAACEFIFLVDRSGSMSGGFIRSARETLVLFLKSLPEGNYFNIIGFGTRFEKLFPQSVPYTQETLDKATEHAEKMQADMGGTNLIQPLQYVFESGSLPGRPRQVFVLTDGSVSNTDTCIQKVKENAHTSRCFTFGIGSGASTALVEGLARAGNGTAEFVKEGERLQPKVIRSLKRALQPAVTDVAVEFKLTKDEAQWEILQSPQKPSVIFNGEKVVVYGILKSKSTPQDKEISGTAVLRGSMLGEVVEHSVPFTFQPTEFQGLPTVHHLAAKALIKDWQTMGRDDKEIVQLSIESSVISSRTAFIAVDEESSEPVAGAMKTWDVQTQMAEYNSRITGRRRYQNQPLQGHLGLLDVQAACDEVSGVMQMNIEKVLQRGERLEDVECQSEALNSSASVFSRSSKATKKSGGFFSSLSNWMFGSSSSSSSSSASPPKPLPVSSKSDVQYFGGGELEGAMFEEMESSEKCADIDDIPEMLPPPRAQALASPAGVTALVTKQQADGSWKLDATLAQLLAKDQKALQDACPVHGQDTATATVWATVLVLTKLRLSYSGQQEEWELIATKAESWLRRQKLPTGTTLEDMYEAAEKLLA